MTASDTRTHRIRAGAQSHTYTHTGTQLQTHMARVQWGKRSLSCSCWQMQGKNCMIENCTWGRSSEKQGKGKMGNGFTLKLGMTPFTRVMLLSSCRKRKQRLNCYENGFLNCPKNVAMMEDFRIGLWQPPTSKPPPSNWPSYRKHYSSLSCFCQGFRWLGYFHSSKQSFVVKVRVTQSRMELGQNCEVAYLDMNGLRRLWSGPMLWLT